MIQSHLASIIKPGSTPSLAQPKYSELCCGGAETFEPQQVSQRKESK